MSAENPADNQLVDYDDAEDMNVTAAPIQEEEDVDTRKGHYATMNSSGFKDFYLKDAIMQAIAKCGFEHPSEVQHNCIPRAITHKDILCQAKSGMGKTAVFVISTLQMLKVDEEAQDIQVLVVAHTRELAFQIQKEYVRFSQFMPNVRTEVFYGGVPVSKDEEALAKHPAIVVGTPGRLLHLISKGSMKLDKLKHFVIDECDHIMESIKMRSDLQEIFTKTPYDKQVMMFTATLPPEVKIVCTKFMNDPLVIELDEKDLTLHGLQQFYIKLEENEKTKKLTNLIDTINFNQLVIFVRDSRRAQELSRVMNSMSFGNKCITGNMKTEDRLKCYQEFRDYEYRILISTDLFGRGIDIERVNMVINYDFPEKADLYLHRVGRAGRFGTKGIAISFISSESDVSTLETVQTKFVVEIPELPSHVDPSLYMN